MYITKKQLENCLKKDLAKANQFSIGLVYNTDIKGSEIHIYGLVNLSVLL